MFSPRNFVALNFNLSVYDPLQINIYLSYKKGFTGGSVVKNPSAKQETQVRSLGGKDTLEEGLATHSSIRAWRIPGTEEPGGLQSLGSQRVRHNKSNLVWTESSSCYSTTCWKGFLCWFSLATLPLLSKKFLIIWIYLYFWRLYSGPLSYLSIFLSILHTLMNINF